MQTNSLTCNVSQLWLHLEAMENQLRFQGKAYPDGMSSFPFRLKGQGFFPGGDGLWRDEDELAAESDGILHKRGVLFLANDFGVLETFKKREKRGFENVPTWRHLKLRAVGACIPTELTFFSNAIMGLREGGTALNPRSWQKMRGFPQFCGEFLDYQLTVLQPRLTVVMGPHAKAAFDALAESAAGRVLYTTHPYADYSFSKERRAAEIAELKSAWRQA